MTDRPNILFLMDDEHRPDVLGYAGDDVVRTPNLDRLAETGIVFENAYTPSPVCVPGRQSMMVGQLPKTCGCEGWVDLEPGSYTFARHFAEHGYMTACAGKLHHQGWDQMQGWRKRLGPVPMKRPTHHKYLEKKDASAFDRWEKDYDRGSPWTWPVTKEINRAGVGRSRVNADDERAVGAAVEYIKQYFSSPYYDRQRRDDRPLLLKVSTIQPHYPYFTTEERFTYYLDRVEPYVEDPTDHAALSRHHVEPGTDVSERELRRATAAYYGMIETADAYYGRILDALEHHGEDLDDWIVVFTSDHGEMLGQHGIWGKGVFYEASVRVPLVIRWPTRFDPGTVTANVNLCDLFATLSDLAGLPVPAGLDSRSLRPLLGGETDAWHRGTYANETISQYDGRDLMIKRDALKYQFYGPGTPEVLFDLARDPDETTNRIDEPAYADALSSFRERRAELGFGPEAGPSYRTAGYD